MYRVYANSNISMANDDKFSFVPFSAKYVLVFTSDDKNIVDGWHEVPENVLYKDERASAWLWNCKKTVNTQAMKLQEAETVKMLNDFLDKFEEELKKTRGSINGRERAKIE